MCVVGVRTTNLIYQDLGKRTMIVRWSDSLERLADGLFEAWRNERTAFRKTCVVVRDMATRDWLKSYYLLNGKHRDVLVNLEFVPLEQFVNDWLFAKTHNAPLNARDPKTHPYSKLVLAWRIYGILADREHLEEEFGPILAYIGSDEKNEARRRYVLAEQLAKLFDDYLNSRFALLCKWENGEDNGEAPAWQRLLYQHLLMQEPQTYAADYHKAIFGDIDRAATDNGFPDYLSIHLFDIPDMPEPTFYLLEKISEEMNVTFWSFNPTGNWLGDTPTIKELISDTRKALREGRNPPSLEPKSVFGSPLERLLGTLAPGARAVLGAQVENGSCSMEDVLGEPGSAFNRLDNDVEVSIHSCYSPKRELESIREGLHRFFAEHSDAKPHDALVLCGDWEHYAPIVEAVFNNEAKNGKIDLPLRVAGGVSGDTPMFRSFRDLLAFRENRFGVAAVFELLGMSAIREKFGLEADDIDILTDMVKKANIHWGLDDDDVNATIGYEQAGKNYPFTWRRGLDRLAMDMIWGESKDTLVEANDLGMLLPTGNVEGMDRVNALKGLYSFIEALAQLRRAFASERSYTSEEWRQKLLGTVDCFYKDSSEYYNELKKIRAAIQSSCNNVSTANFGEPIPSDVFIPALLSIIKNTVPGGNTTADAVLFAPLKSAVATPHRFVWICGLNDGAFPRIEHRSSFDVIGTHPSLFDVTMRDKDGFALLKAVLSAGDSLALSYVGRDIRSNEKIPSSVMLDELEEYLVAVGNPPMRFEHPLQAYSMRYFTANGNLPASYSASDYHVAQALLDKAQSGEGFMPCEAGFTAFTLNENGETLVEADDLADFFAHPNKYLIKRRLNLSPTWIDYLCDEDVQAAELGRQTKTELILNPDLASERNRVKMAEIAIEQGNAPDSASMEKMIADFVKTLADEKSILTYPLSFRDNGLSKAEYTCPNVCIVDAYKTFRNENGCGVNNWQEREIQVPFQLDGNMVSIHFKLKSIVLETLAGKLEHTFYMVDASDVYDSSLAEYWIRHVIGHAAGLKFATVAFGQESKPARTFRPIEENEAKELLGKYLRAAFSALPSDYPDLQKTASKDDKPFVNQELVVDVGVDAKMHIVSTFRSGGKKSKKQN